MRTWARPGVFALQVHGLPRSATLRNHAATRPNRAGFRVYHRRHSYRAKTITPKKDLVAKVTQADSSCFRQCGVWDERESRKLLFGNHLRGARKHGAFAAFARRPRTHVAVIDLSQ